MLAATDRERTMLVVFGGLPRTGKTTIASLLAARRSATYLRIDVIEQAMRAANGSEEIGPEGYQVAAAIAASNLAIGRTVVADCVNPVHESRAGWRAMANRARKPILEIEIVCSDLAEHRRRVEERCSDIDGLILPSWQAVLDFEYGPWRAPHVTLDTAGLSAAEATAIVERHMDA